MEFKSKVTKLTPADNVGPLVDVNSLRVALDAEADKIEDPVERVAVLGFLMRMIDRIYYLDSFYFNAAKTEQGRMYSGIQLRKQ